jgi:hypothetical protein
MSRIPTDSADRAFAERSARARKVAKVRIALRMATLAATTFMTLSFSAVAADRESLYPEGSIFAEPPLGQPSPAARTKAGSQEAQISPLNPLDAPDAGNVWKPSNRDAGNLSARRWEEYAEKRAAAQHRTQ